MDKIYSFLEILDSQHEKFKTESVNIDSLINGIDFYESFIPDFFSKNGEANGIRAMYKGIRESLENEKTINAIDVNKSAEIYNEYMEGMIEFILDISNITFVEACDELKIFEEKFEKAKEKDCIFIESLYDGKLNEETEMVLSEAVSNIEFLIDFIPQLKTMKERCINLNESFKNKTENQEIELVNKSLEMLYESVNNYCYSTVKNIVTTYYDINDKLFNVTPSSNEEKPMFQLF